MLKSVRSGAISILVAVLTLAGCASNGPVMVAGAPKAPQRDQSPEYIIGTGDTLRISVLQNADLNAEVPVRPDGRVSTPLVNDMVAAGKTPSALAHDIEQALSEYVRGPKVSVIVTKATSTSSQVKVVGQAVSPRAVPYTNGMTVLDLVIEVGGLSQFAAGNRAKVLRPGDGKTEEISVKLDDLLNKGRLSENIPLKPGDILFIPESLF